MNCLTASRLLAVWERGAGMLPVQRVLALLATAFPDDSPDDLAVLPIGQRDYRLLKLREQVFGSRFTCLTDCPVCSEHVEMSFQVSDIPIQSTPPTLDGSLVADLDGYQLRFRLPTSQDFQEVLKPMLTDNGREVLDRSGNQSAGPRKLMEQCVLEATLSGEVIRLDELPPAILEVMRTQITEADPFAELWVALSCPSCGNKWRSLFDIISYVWDEIDTWAYRTLQEVHFLAKSYGWCEADILELSAWRRHFYLSLL